MHGSILSLTVAGNHPSARTEEGKSTVPLRQYTMWKASGNHPRLSAPWDAKEFGVKFFTRYTQGGIA
ncbi:MAG: hypothetical protein D6762_05125 [Candidatus Neomarinimicrobiota bacterium]|nr:MAG: hypothetical protein D6762_05125 [Candidatus Neomarinimicrobiota bacterium]